MPATPIDDLLSADGPIKLRTLLRAITEHLDWFAAVPAFPKRQTLDELVLPPTGSLDAAPYELWLFGDQAAAERSPHALGLGAHISGVDLVANLSADIGFLHINPGSKRHISVRLLSTVRRHLALLAKAIPLERTLESLGVRGAKAVVEHPTLFVVFDQYGPLALSARDRLVANGILVFTSSDAIDAFLERVPLPHRASLEVNSMSGRELFSKTITDGFDGALVNPFGPRGIVVFAADDFLGLVATAKDAGDGSGS